MTYTYKKGIAFIYEGDTEKYFYQEFLSHKAKGMMECGFHTYYDNQQKEVVSHSLVQEEYRLIKHKPVGTITQMPNIAEWIKNSCVINHPGIPWNVCLCYDTDSYKDDLSKFHEGDWKDLREKLLEYDIKDICDLAAKADIEDIMLSDYIGVCNFLSIPVDTVVTGKKGKSKMKKLFREAGKSYHEGERAQPLIKALDYNKIEQSAIIDFSDMIKYCFY